jgi:DNA-binding winged helix-turn-helix (wHTH) protein
MWSGSLFKEAVSAKGNASANGDVAGTNKGAEVETIPQHQAQDRGWRSRFGAGDLQEGTTEIGVPHVQIKLIRLLASARDDDGWKFVERPEIIMHVWGEDFEVDPITTTERLRKLRNRIRKTLGMEITDSIQSGSKRLPRYRLISDIEIIEE